jgi:hypothetical protein
MIAIEIPWGTAMCMWDLRTDCSYSFCFEFEHVYDCCFAIYLNSNNSMRTHLLCCYACIYNTNFDSIIDILSARAKYVVLALACACACMCIINCSAARSNNLKFEL